MITVQQMKELEGFAEQQGISKLELMENAGKKIYETVSSKYDIYQKYIIIFAGSGNNGGDGFVAARYFSEDNPVIVLFFGEEERLSPEAKTSYEQIKRKVTVIQVRKKEDLVIMRFPGLVLIDAMLGTGRTGNIREPVSLGIDLFNSMKGIKIAVDIPSGLNPDTGQIHDKICKVDLIITFHDLKPGLEQFKEKTIVVDIGLPKHR
ncbi:MAG: NAD(P)H-hydrate epimerase [Candidatus Woesearchaeota archaeon]